MKKILIKSTLIILTFLAIGGILKMGDNFFADAKASVSDAYSYTCGVNNGWIFNGTNCVNTCDQNHPWDTNLKKCSTPGDYLNNSNYFPNINCAVAYGQNYYFDGQKCLEYTSSPNVDYYGNPYNGGTQMPIYRNSSYQPLPHYQNQPPINSNIYTNTSFPNWVLVNNQYNNNTCQYGCYTDGGAKTTKYYISTITTTTSQPQGTPIYLGNNNFNAGYDYFYGNSLDTFGGNYMNTYYNDYPNYGNSYYGGYSDYGSYYNNDYTNYASSYNSGYGYGAMDTYYNGFFGY